LSRHCHESARAYALVALLGVAPLAALAADELDDLDALGFDQEVVELSLFGAIRGADDAPEVPRSVRALGPEARVAAVQTLGLFAKSYFASAAFKTAYGKAYKESMPHGLGVPSLNVKDIAKSAAGKAAKKDHAAEVSKVAKDPRVQLKRRLHEFLEATEDVDYRATTHANGSFQIFDKSEYESKPREWRMCYRAGRETADAVRAFARDWLAELN
jgi:hypothetical protein